jgi:hypothetical protein
MESINHIFTPLEASLKLTRYDCPTIETKHFLMEVFPYSQVVGNLMHVLIYSRPTDSYSVGWTLLNFYVILEKFIGKLSNVVFNTSIPLYTNALNTKNVSLVVF